MIYTNQKLVAVEKTFDFGTIYQVTMGEIGRGRKLMVLTCPKGTELKEGLNPNYSIGTIKVLASHKTDFEILSRGNVADGAAGRIGFWDCMLLKTPNEGIIRVRTSGAGYGTPSDLYSEGVEFGNDWITL